MSSSLRHLLLVCRDRLGPLGWGVLIVFFVLRTGDIATYFCKLVLGRYLSVSDFGAFDPVFSLLAFLVLPFNVFAQVSVKSLSRMKATGRKGEFATLCRYLVNFSIVWLLMVAVIEYLFRHFFLLRLHLESEHFIYVVILLTAVLIFLILFLALFQGTLDYRSMMIFSVTHSFLLIGLTLVLVVLNSFGLLGAFLSRVFAGLVAVGVAVFLALPQLRVKGQECREELVLMMKMYGPMVLYTVSLVILFGIDKLFIRNFLVEESGGYGAITTLGILPCYMITPVIYVIFPLASAEHVSGRDLTRFFRQSLLIGVSITLLFTLAFALFSAPLMRLWNNAFLPYAKYVWIYAFVMGLHGMVQIVASVEMARHRYGFLWFFAGPSAIMIVLLYFWRSCLTVPIVLTLLTITHTVILVCIALLALVSKRGRSTS